MNTDQSRPEIQTLRVSPHEEGWALYVGRVPMPAWVVSSRDRAIRAAEGAARDHGATLSVLDRRGKVVQSKDYRS